MKKKTEWIYTRTALTIDDIWNLFPHKRNEYLSDFEVNTEMQLYYITSMKKKYRRKKK